MTAELIALMGAVGVAFLVWGLTLWVPEIVIGLSPRLRIRQRLRLLAAPRRITSQMVSFLDRLVVDAGRPFGWSGATWGRYGLLVGIVLGCFVWWLTGLQISTLAFAALFVLAGPALIYWVLRQEMTVLERRRKAETVRLIDGIQVLLANGGQSLFGAINATLPMLSTLRAPAERLLARWGHDPIQALDEFHAEVPMDETAMLSAVLQHAVQTGEHEAVSFLAQESTKLEKLREEQIKELIQSRPQLFTLALIFPLSAVALVFLYPFFYRIVEMVRWL